MKHRTSAKFNGDVIHKTCYDNLKWIFLREERRRHDTHHNDIQHNDTQHNDIQHNDTQHNYTQHNNK